MDLDDSIPATQPAFADYKSDSDTSHKLEVLDCSSTHDIEVLDCNSNLEPPPLAQKPMSHSIFPLDFYLLAASQKQKMSPLLGDDDDVLMLSSEDESVECTNTSMVAVKTEPVEPVSMCWLTSSTTVAAMLKAPPTNQLKTETSATTGTVAPASKAIICSAYRKKHLPKGCQMENK
ncbi:uncharacterized protein BJ212DRAFT_1483522 [Suillus subaureus]|uniref:Uncharacterized protein n=1 Tax=Suillus subaureus TaxID=48587 RepID=A0A9P7E5F5_9AGAM|nr:uncharacterized protein BJ212DRAFT_1483522 [Suillus subaureus]KAG1811797.1 hypothetical protein BJ212DRAFT_1483522 [Suillus subaureus]